jgi:hypothetical protein
VVALCEQKPVQNHTIGSRPDEDAVMGSFHRVEDEQAGPTALGILVPPGRRTFVILRPRALAWDLLLVRSAASGVFHDMSREEAAIAAQRLYRALQAWAAGGPGQVEVFAAPGGTGFQVRAVVAAATLVVCPRNPGQPYQPLVLPDADAAQAAAGALTAVLCPRDGAEQELYFNGRHFSR